MVTKTILEEIEEIEEIEEAAQAAKTYANSYIFEGGTQLRNNAYDKDNDLLRTQLRI